MTQNKNNFTSKSSLQEVNTSSDSASESPLTVTVTNIDRIKSVQNKRQAEAQGQSKQVPKEVGTNSNMNESSGSDGGSSGGSSGRNQPREPSETNKQQHDAALSAASGQTSCSEPDKNVDVPNPATAVASNPILATSYLASEVLEKARTRFDMFWGKSKQTENDK